MSALNIQLLCRKSKKKKKSLNYRHLLPDGTIINPQWLEPHMSRTIFYGPKDVRAIEVRLYVRVYLLTQGILYKYNKPVSVAQLDAPSDWRPGGRGFNPRRGRQHSFVEIDHEIFSTVILSLPLIQEGQLPVSDERMCTILVNRLED